MIVNCSVYPAINCIQLWALITSVFRSYQCLIWFILWFHSPNQRIIRSLIESRWNLFEIFLSSLSRLSLIALTNCYHEIQKFISISCLSLWVNHVRFASFFYRYQNELFVNLLISVIRRKVEKSLNLNYRRNLTIMVSIIKSD